MKLLLPCLFVIFSALISLSCRVTQQETPLYNSAVTPESQAMTVRNGVGVGKTVTIETERAEFSAIDLYSPDSVKFVTTVGTGKDVKVNIALMAKTIDEIDTFAKSFKVSNNRGQLKIDTRTDSYSCFFESSNDVVTRLEGLCIERIVVEIPLTSQTDIYWNDLPQKTFHPMSIDRLQTTLTRQTSENDKVKVVKAFRSTYQAGEKTFPVGALAFFLRKNFVSDEAKIEVVQALRDQIQDPENADQIGSAFTFSENQKRASNLIRISN
jgi:hypothetical protein